MPFLCGYRMADTVDKEAARDENYSSSITGLRDGYELEMSKMERWASKERDSIETSYVEGGRQADLWNEIELEELDTLRRLNTIRIAKRYFGEAQYRKGSVDSKLESARYRKTIIKTALNFAETANFPEEELTEFKETYRLAEEEETLLMPAKEAFETFQKEMYAHICP